MHNILLPHHMHDEYDDDAVIARFYCFGIAIGTIWKVILTSNLPIVAIVAYVI